MTDTSTSRPLPTDWGTLKAYLPAEPDDSTVTRARHAIARIDAALAAAHAELDRHDQTARAAATNLADAALTDAALEPLAARLTPGDRATLEHRVTQLQSARSIASQRLAEAERTDPLVAAWRQRCDTITREWQLAQSADTDDQRFAQLVRFAERH